MAIQNLNQGAPSLSSSVPFYDAANGRDARCSITELQALILNGLSSSGMQTQYAAPNASGFAISVSPTVLGASVWLLLTPLASYAVLTVTLPAGVDGQEVLIFSTQPVTGSLLVLGTTVGASPQPINGAPATLAANGFFRMRFDGVSGSWYRVG